MSKSVSNTRAKIIRVSPRGKETIEALLKELGVIDTNAPTRSAEVVREEEWSHEDLKVNLQSGNVSPTSALDELARRQLSLDDILNFFKNFASECSDSASIDHYAKTRNRDLISYELNLLIASASEMNKRMQEASKLLNGKN